MATQARKHHFAHRGFKDTLGACQFFIQVSAIFDVGCVDAALGQQHTGCFTASGPQGIQFIRYSGGAANGKRSITFGRSHAYKMTDL